MSSHGRRGLLREGRGTTGASLIVPIERREWGAGWGDVGRWVWEVGESAWLRVSAWARAGVSDKGGKCAFWRRGGCADGRSRTAGDEWRRARA